MDLLFSEMSFESLTLENYGIQLDSMDESADDSDEDPTYGEKW